MTGLLIGFCAVLVVALVANIAALYASKFEFRVETDIALAELDEIVRGQMAGATPFQKTQGSLEHGYERVLKRGIGPYRSEARIMVDVMPIAGSDAVVVNGWVDEFYFGRQLLIFADPFGGPAPIWGARKLRKVLSAIEIAADEHHARIEVTTDHDGNHAGSIHAAPNEGVDPLKASGIESRKL